MSKPVRIDDDVLAYLEQHGRFGDSYSDILRRLLPGFEPRKRAPRKQDAGKRYPPLFGHSIVSVIRWMETEGWAFPDVRKVLNSYPEYRTVADKTIRCQLEGAQRGKPAVLTDEQRKELNNRRMDDWEQVWAELCDNLQRQPRCAEHPDLPRVLTPDQGVVNDMLRTDQDGVRVRSHRTGNEDVIPVSSFRAWWDHLRQHGTAALDPNDRNCPRSDRAVLVGAILACCLPNRIERQGSQIRLLPGS